MSNPQNHAEQHRVSWEGRSRRRFFLKLMSLGAAGLTVGSGAAWTSKQLAELQTSLASANTQLADVTAAHNTLQVSYTTLQSHNTELESQVTSLSGQNTQLASALSTAQQEAADLRAQLASLQTDLASAQTRVAKQSGLVQLYEQLEQFGLDDVVAGGMNTIASTFANLNDPADLLRIGIKQGRVILQNFNDGLVEVTDAMGWLGEKVVLLKVGLWLIENKAQETVGAALTGITSVFSGFVGFVMDYLPFNIGKQVRETLAATQSVLATLAEVADEADDQVMLKIAALTNAKGSAKSWHHTLINPLEDKTLTAADNMLDAVGGAGVSLAKEVIIPAKVVLEQRQQLREQIAVYRATEQV